MDQPMGIVDRYAPIFGAQVKPGFADSPGASDQPLPAVSTGAGPGNTIAARTKPMNTFITF
jgi:hypothetical protein